ncbi:MAG TPA: NADH-quinone oxidoreductase subunit J [Pyrinomonadaceae bacterium]|nr:NADH-quinone oxidoreductase subunit J [Pyrinomonadaceae bacterium]
MVLSGWEAVFFWVFSITALFMALLMIMARNAVHSALFLISTLVSVAALFVLAGAEFVAGAQVLVYIGGVMVLFLFVIMLVNVGAEERGKERLFNSNVQVTATAVLGLLLAFGLVYAINQGVKGINDSRRGDDLAQQRATEQRALPTSATGDMKITADTQRIGNSLYRYASLPFEIASLLLLVAIVGSVMLARTLKQEAAADDVDPEILKEAVAASEERAELESVSR